MNKKTEISFEINKGLPSVRFKQETKGALETVVISAAVILKATAEILENPQVQKILATGLVKLSELNPKSIEESKPDESDDSPPQIPEKG